MLLAIDTSAGTSVALVDLEAGVIAEHSSDDTRGHAELIGILIERCLDGRDPGTLSGVVAGMGPGPFTGLRVGIAAAKAFAFGIGRSLVTIASHDAVAFAAAMRGSMEPLIVVTDARRNEVAFTEYAAPDAEGLPVVLRGPELLPRAELLTLGPLVVESPTISAGALGMLAERLYAARRPFGPSEPLYLRQPDVTISSGPKRVTS